MPQRWSILLRRFCFAVALLAAAFTMHAADEVLILKPFNGDNLEGWVLKHHPKNTSKWMVGSASLDRQDPRQLVIRADGGERADPGDELINAQGQGVDIYSNIQHGDALIELEVMVPKGANSGIYVHGEYEIQVLDSYGVEKPGPGDMGAIYGAAPPSNPLYLKPGEWQTFQIVFRAPRFDQLGRKSANARFEKVVLNGRTIHENVELKGVTPGGVDGKEDATGPLMFQGDHGPVALRNIVIRPLK